MVEKSQFQFTRFLVTTVKLIISLYRRSISRAEAEALTRRVHQLEELLSTHSQNQSSPSSLSEQLQQPPQLTGSSGVLLTAIKESTSESGGSQISPIPAPQEDVSPASTKLSSRSDAEEQLSVVRTLVPSPIRFDMSSGRVRYFGPTTTMNVLTTSSPNKSLEKREAHWPICLVLRDLSPETHDYLMDLHWTCNNSVLHLVHSVAFYHDLEHGGTQFYSTFLHISILASAFKYADKNRKDIQQLAIASGPVGSTLHEKARAMAKLEQDKPGGIPSIQAFGLLADLDFNMGRDDSGWLFAGKLKYLPCLFSK